MVSVVSSNPTGGNFIFLRNLDANFVQKWQKCQICCIYENLDLQVWKGGHVDTSRLKKCKVHKYNINPHYADFTIVTSDGLQTSNSNRRTTFHYASKQKQKYV